MTEKHIKYAICAGMPFWLFWMILTVLYAIVFIIIEFWGSPFSSLRGGAIIFGQWCVVSAAAGGILGVISVNRIVFAISFPLLALLSTAVVYFKVAMGVILTPVCIELTLVTDLKTSMTVITPQLVVLELLALFISIIISVYRYKKVYFRKQWHVYAYIAASIVFAAMPFCIKRMSAPVFNRLPYSLWYNVDQYIVNRQNVEEVRDTYNNTVVGKGDNPPDVVVIIGESLRADHLNLNGYDRCTMPLLTTDTAVVSLPNIITVPFHTFRSVPHIMTRADSVNTEAAFNEQSFITLFKNAGYSTIWLSNQETSASYAYFMHEADSLVYGNAVKSVYGFDKWLDTDLIPHFSNVIDSGNNPRLVVMHTIGSHWWYNSHYSETKAIFQPEINSKVLSDLTREQIINSYDNTIVETDYFIWNVIEKLRDRNAVLIYISDHGEALGEDGNYLHGADYPQLHNPAMLVWYSHSYAAIFPKRIKSLKENRNIKASTDIIFHSVLDGAGIKTDVKNTSLSIFSNGKN